MTDTTTHEMTRLYREITRLGQEALASPILAVKRGQQIGALYTGDRDTEAGYRPAQKEITDGPIDL